MTRLTLHAAATTVTLTAAAERATIEADADRVVSGLVLPYGPVGHTSIGPVRVPSPGRVVIPEDLSRVKLMDYHQTPPVAVGYCTAMRETPEGLRASFHVARTQLGEAALLDVRERVRDGLSVELFDIDLRGDELLAGHLSGVALVPIPAFAGARHDGLAAAQSTTTTTTTKGSTMPMTPEQRARLAELLAMSGRTPEQEAEYNELVQLALAEATAQGDTPAADAPPADAQPAAGQLAAGQPAQLHASVPAGVPGTPPRQNRPQRDIRELYASMARVLSGHSRPELEAALADITSTANIWTSADEFSGQLWSGLEFNRKFIPLMAPGELRSYKGTGWRWTTKPEVGDYAGDKAAVPSNVPVSVEVPWTAARLAGAHDIDRKYFDFGDTDFIEAYYQAMRESYARKSDDKARAFLVASGLANSAGAAGTGMFRAAAVAAQSVDDDTNGATVDYFLINSTDRMALLDITSADIPAYLEAFGVTPDKFVTASGVPAGTVIAGAKQATTFKELSGTPIRVEAINVANGGVDGGVFGYYATLLNEQGGIASATFI